MLEVLPDRSSDDGEFSPVAFVDGTGPGWQRHGAADSRLFQPATLTRIADAEWEAFLGFASGEIEASVYQGKPGEMLRIVAGQFDFDRVRVIRDVIVSNGYDEVDSSASLPEFRRVSSAKGLQDRFPTIEGIDEGAWDTIAFINNETLAVAASPQLVRMVRVAERKRIPNMTFGPGIGAICEHEPEATYEAVIVPGSHVREVTGAPRLLGVGVFASYPESGLAASQGVSGARATWTVISTFSWQERGRFVTEEEMASYADRVETMFDLATSTRTGAPFTELMTIRDISADHGTLIIEFLPRSSIEGYYELTDMALNRDLGFLCPTEV